MLGIMLGVGWKDSEAEYLGETGSMAANRVANI